MTLINLAESHPTLEEVMGLAKDEVVVLRGPTNPRSPYRNWAILRSRPNCIGIIPIF